MIIYNPAFAVQEFLMKIEQLCEDWRRGVRHGSWEWMKCGNCVLMIWAAKLAEIHQISMW